MRATGSVVPVRVLHGEDDPGARDLVVADPLGVQVEVAVAGGPEDLAGDGAEQSTLEVEQTNTQTRIGMFTDSSDDVPSAEVRRGQV
jgi:hypothetical protein